MPGGSVLDQNRLRLPVLRERDDRPLEIRETYPPTPHGKQVLRSKQESWKDFVAAISRITGIEHA